MIKTALLHTTRLIDNYQSHCTETYTSFDVELNSLKEHMKQVITRLEGKEFDGMEVLQSKHNKNK